MKQITNWIIISIFALHILFISNKINVKPQTQHASIAEAIVLGGIGLIGVTITIYANFVNKQKDREIALLRLEFEKEKFEY